MNKSLVQLHESLVKPLDYTRTAILLDQLSEAEAYQAYLIGHWKDGDRDQRALISKYLRAIEKRLSLGQTFLRRADEEIKRGLNRSP